MEKINNPDAAASGLLIFGQQAIKLGYKIRLEKTYFMY